MDKRAGKYFAQRDLGYADEIIDFSSINFYMASKRLFDLTLLACASPFILLLIAICAVLVRCDGGPVFYSQLRVGKNGVVYKLWKLRTMIPNSDHLLREQLARSPAARHEWRTKQKLTNDPRITRVGRYLRSYSLDELPQVFNVLKGDMSIVGPRPILPEQLPLYPGMAYFDMRPGLTGLWQISERNECAFVDRAKYDSRYAAILSFTLDAWIIWRTVFVVIRGTGL